MELKRFTENFKALIGEDDMCGGISESLFSEHKNDVLSRYVDLVDGDLTTDYLQKIFQYYYADRKNYKQDFTPKSLGKLCAALTETGGKIVYDLCAGSGALTIGKWVRNPDKVFICEELDARVMPFLLFNMAARNMTGYAINRNALTGELSKCFTLTAGQRFSEIRETDTAPEIKADEIISNPPFNIKWDPPVPLMADERFKGKPVPPAANANYAFVLPALARLSPKGRCAFILPCGTLSSNNEKEIRKYLISNGFLERVILLPDSMFENTSIPICVEVFSYGNDAVGMWDCRQKYETEEREQNGQYGGPAHENRTYKKTVKVLSDDLIDSLNKECKNVPEFSGKIDYAEIQEKDYTFLPSRYIELAERETQHRPYADIMADINRISRERSAVKITCNETYAKTLGIYEVAKAEEEAADIDLDKAFSLLGGHYENRRYLTLTKSKELKIESQDKEALSSLIVFFMPMWKQHIYYLNNEENRLLTELRDAMLPDLMDGTIRL